MRRTTALATLALAAALAACGKEETPGPAKTTPEPAKTPAVEPDKPTPPKETGAMPGAPSGAKHTTLDAKGHDWASHMGDIPFLLDDVAAVARAKESGKPLMIFYTGAT